jgi:hypothetical protein
MPKLNGLIKFREPPKNRAGKAEGGLEKDFTEAAVMLAYAIYLLGKYDELNELELHPDGEHGKRFEIRDWLESQGYVLVKPQGKTAYGGRYTNGSRSILVRSRPGMGDVLAKMESYTIVAECKGGIINTKHAGQKSRLRRGLCEAVGLLMSRETTEERHYAVVPLTDDTQRLAERMRPRCTKAGIEIVLIREDGTLA